MGKLQVPDGCQLIPLHRNVSGDNFRPIYDIVGYAIVDDVDFQWLNQHHWLMREDFNTGNFYAHRVEHHGKRTISISMAREILGLPRDVGRGSGEADHKDHNTLNNRRENLRVVTNSESVIHRRKWGSLGMPKGVVKNKTGNGYRAYIQINSLRVRFLTLSKMNEVWFMRKEAEKILHAKFNCSEDIPEDLMPPEERQQWLRELVIKTLREWGFVCH